MCIVVSVSPHCWQHPGERSTILPVVPDFEQMKATPTPTFFSCLRAFWLLGVCTLIGCAVPQVESSDPGVVFEIDMLEPIQRGWFDPETEQVGLRGDRSPLSWENTQIAEDVDGDGIYKVTVVFSLGNVDSVRVPYKFKVDGTENPNDGWENGANRFITYTGASQTISRRFDEAETFGSSRTGTIRTHEAVSSTFLDLPRNVYVYLPPEYDTSNDRYPVLYMHDGLNIFDEIEMGMEWQVDETAERLIARHEINPMIIVGIGNTAQRTDEYTPTQARMRGDLVGGKGPAYGRFVVEELKPFIDKTYRTLPGAEQTGLGGSSLGGLISMYLGIEYPNVFGTLLVVSPSVWWDDEMIIEHIRDQPERISQRIWLDIGTAEGRNAVRGARRLRDALVDKGWVPSEDLRYLEVEDAPHNEIAWAARVEPMLRFVSLSPG